MSGIIANTSDVSWVAESGDCINRQDAINVAIQAADDWDGGYNPERAEMIERGLKMLPALQTQPCEDCISRQAVLEVQIKYAEHMGATKYWQMRDDIRALPPVTPKAESENILAKIKAEIEQKCCITVGSENEPAITLYDVFQIIDKYKTESEDKR